MIRGEKKEILVEEKRKKGRGFCTRMGTITRYKKWHTTKRT